MQHGAPSTASAESTGVSRRRLLGVSCSWNNSHGLGGSSDPTTTSSSPSRVLSAFKNGITIPGY